MISCLVEPCVKCVVDGVKKAILPSWLSGSEEKVESNGRTYSYISAGSLFILGSMTGGGAIFAYFAPSATFSISSWVAGTFLGTVTAVTYVGAGCLCKDTVSKNHEDLIAEFKEISLQRTNDNKELRGKLKEMEHTIQDLELEIRNQKGTCLQMEKEREQDVLQLQENLDKKKELIHRLEEVKVMALNLNSCLGENDEEDNDFEKFDYTSIKNDIKQRKAKMALLESSSSEGLDL